MQAVELLEKENISCDLINIHTIKPLDEEAVIHSIKKTGCIVTAEEHQQNGGLGDSIAQVAGLHYPCPHEYVAVKDTFGESGKPLELLEKYGLNAASIVTAAKKAINRKV